MNRREIERFWPTLKEREAMKYAAAKIDENDFSNAKQAECIREFLKRTEVCEELRLEHIFSAAKQCRGLDMHPLLLTLVEAIYEHPLYKGVQS